MAMSTRVRRGQPKRAYGQKEDGLAELSIAVSLAIRQDIKDLGLTGLEAEEEFYRRLKEALWPDGFHVM